MKKIALNFLALWLLIVALSSVSAFGQSSPDFVRLTGNVPAALTHAQYIGHHDPTSILRVTIALKLRNTEQLQQFLEAVQDPTSSEYHQFLTPQQFWAKYGPTKDQLTAVLTYLGEQGLHVTDVTPDNRLIHIRDYTGILERGLGVQINDNLYKGRTVYGTTVGPQFPTAIANIVQSVLGLENIVQFHSMLTRSADYPGINLCFTNPSSIPVGYSPQQIATAYNWPSITNTVNGSGVTIAIATLDSKSLSASDYDSFWSYYGLPTHTVTIIPVDGNTTADDGRCETTIDTERSGAMAPGAAILIYEGAQNTYKTLVDVFEQIANDNKAQIVTTSFGTPEPDIENQGTPPYWQTEDGYLQQAAAEGMSIFAASGDGGSSDCRGAPCDNTADVADFPSSDPNIIAAGGTTLTLNGNNTIASETAWSYSCDNYGDCSGTGGAQSILFTAEPSWQEGTGVPQNGVRNTSDLSMDADGNTGYSVYIQGAWTDVPIGGTSFVAPQLAALFAIQASLSSTRMGPANFAIYIDANSSNYLTDFHDITSGNNGAFNSNTGWDHPTGWGSINAINLLSHVEGSETLSPPTNLSAEYTQCVDERDKYFISWQAGQVGNSIDYDAEYQVSNGGWTSFRYGPSTTAQLTFLPNSYVGIRVRATNGPIWSSYTSIAFSSAPCSPAP